MKARLEETVAPVTSLLTGWSCCSRELARGKLLIIRRSPEPAFYQPGGGAKIERYGLGRRHFLGIEDGVEQRISAGFASMVYEPGAHNFACQINHFSACAGVVGVRGAEFANVVWAPPSTRIVMFLSDTFPNPNPPPCALAKLLGQAFFEIPHEGEASPKLDIEKLRPLLG